MVYYIAKLDTVGPGLLQAKSAGAISELPFASRKDARRAAIAYAGEEALANGSLVILEQEGEGGVSVWEAFEDGPGEEDGPWAEGWEDRCSV